MNAILNHKTIYIMRWPNMSLPQMCLCCARWMAESQGFRLEYERGESEPWIYNTETKTYTKNRTDYYRYVKN